MKPSRIEISTQIRSQLVPLLLALPLLAQAQSVDDSAHRRYTAEIRRTGMGVPHIKARNWGDLGYGYGYAQAEDNLCTMADSFLTYRGERSRYLGADGVPVAGSTLEMARNLESDFFHKHVLSWPVLNAMIAAQPDELRSMVRGFAAGYNRYLSALKSSGNDAHRACRNAAWLTPVSDDDVYRRMLAANLAGGYSNFVNAIATAVPPAPGQSAQTAAPDASTLAGALRAPQLQVGGKQGLGSNAIAYGSAATGTGSALLFGNPHWYWRGADRFYQAQLTIPGQLNVSGASFLGVPVILIGYNENIAWSHTVSAARRFGFFELTLAPGDSTSYLRDGKPVKMTPVPLSVQVLQPNGRPGTVRRTLYRSEYGPMVNLGLLNPGLAWNQRTAFAIRDINAGNFRSFRNWLRWNRAASLDEFIRIQKEEAATPWVNTVAIGRGSSQAWYADMGAVPNVSAAQSAACTTPVGQMLAAVLPRVPFLDGSRGACNWRTDADSVQRGALGPSKMPSLLRSDYVANMNDSYWSTNPKALLTGFPDIMGDAGTASLSMRTRLGHLLAQGRLDGTDGYGGKQATVDTVKQMVLNSRVLTAELFKAQALPLVCAQPAITLSSDPETGETFPPQSVDTSNACAILRAWDNSGNPGVRGPHLWDEFWRRAALLPEAQLYLTPFDPADAIRTPRDLNPATATDLQQAFAAALRRVQLSGYAQNAARGETLFATRNLRKISLYGGCEVQGYFTVACSEQRLDQGGYSMDSNPLGSSYLQIVSFPAGTVEAHTFLTFSLSDDPASAHYGDYTARYAARNWLKLPFTESQIRSDPAYRSLTIGD